MPFWIKKQSKDLIIRFANKGCVPLRKLLTEMSDKTMIH